MENYSLNVKKFKIKKEDIKTLIGGEANRGCFATDKITVEGKKIGYMQRLKPDVDSSFPDSGWRFFAGDEDEVYLSDSANIEIFDLNTICNYDPEIIPLLNAPYNTAYYRDEDGKFVEEKIEE